MVIISEKICRLTLIDVKKYISRSLNSLQITRFRKHGLQHKAPYLCWSLEIIISVKAVSWMYKCLYHMNCFFSPSSAPQWHVRPIKLLDNFDLPHSNILEEAHIEIKNWCMFEINKINLFPAIFVAIGQRIHIKTKLQKRMTNLCNSMQ